MKQEMSYSVLSYVFYTVVPLFICKDIESKPQGFSQIIQFFSAKRVMVKNKQKKLELIRQKGFPWFSNQKLRM